MNSGPDHKKTIAIVTYPGTTLLELVGTYSMLVGLTVRGGYQIAVVAEHAGPTESDTPLQFIPDKTLDQVPDPAMLFVMGGASAVREMGNERLLAYLQKSARSAELVGSVDTGSLPLAAAGLLTGKQATTHWAYRSELERLGACYVREAWTEDGKFITAAGVSGALDMGLHLLDQRVGRDFAGYMQTNAEYEPEPPFGGLDWRVATGKEMTYRARLEKAPAAPAVRKQIAFVLYPGLTPLDLVGPLQVLTALTRFAPEYETVVVGERAEPMRADNGLTLIPNRTFEEVPHPYAIIVPGGGMPTIQAMSNQRLRSYLREATRTAEFVGSVCTGALILASLGLLQGKPATTHWAFYKLLESFGARYERKRWVENGRIINSAGVSAGIDMALFFASRLTGEETARQVQLAIQYDPCPPLGKIDWAHLSPSLRVLRGLFSLAAPMLTARPKRLLRDEAPIRAVNEMLQD